MLEGMVLAGARAEIAEKLERTRAFLPKIDCWALVDSIVPTYRFKPQELPQVREFILPLLQSEREFDQRFALVVLLDYFLTPEYAAETAELVAVQQSDKYYVNMARAWILAELAVQQEALTFALLESGRLDAFTHNKTISKMCDSYRILEASKDRARALRRREKQ